MKDGVSPVVEAVSLAYWHYPTTFGSLGAREGHGGISPCAEGGRMRDAGIGKEL